MRPKRDAQERLEFAEPRLKVTREYYAKYDAIASILDQNPRILSRVHACLETPLQNARKATQSGEFGYTSDTVLRILIAQVLEAESLRSIVVRIDSCSFLRNFVRIFEGPMMDFTTLCKLKNTIDADTWQEVNRMLAKHAVSQGACTGEHIRLDTTAVETNIHWPTDSSMLWDTYRVLAGLIDEARELCPSAVGTPRIHLKRVKKIALKIARKATKGPDGSERLKPLYVALLDHVTGILRWAAGTAEALRALLGHGSCSSPATAIAAELDHFQALGQRVVEQTQRRVVAGEVVPNSEKIFSIFESHTELLKRGKAGKPIEFGHMIQICQAREKFITDYEVFERKPIEHELLSGALDRHKKLFGAYPEIIAADKGYYSDMSAIESLEKKVTVVSIGKKGKRTEEEKAREHEPLFRLAQRFRAGVEGTISFLKRALRLHRCMNKGWAHFAATVGATVFAHNLLVLARC